MPSMNRDFAPQYGEMPLHNLFPYYQMGPPGPQSQPASDSKPDLAYPSQLPMNLGQPSAQHAYPDPNPGPSPNLTLMYPAFGQKPQPPQSLQQLSYHQVPPVAAANLQVPRTQYSSYDWYQSPHPMHQSPQQDFMRNKQNQMVPPSPMPKRTSPRQNYTDPANAHVCGICGKQFQKAYNLKSHMRTHSSERPYKCRMCPKTFARSHDRKRHENLHGGEKNFICEGYLSDGVTKRGCGKRFARADALARHFRTESGYLCIRQLTEEQKEFEG